MSLKRYSVAEDRCWLVPLSALVRERLGLKYPEEKWEMLHGHFMSAMELFGYTDPLACLSWLSAQAKDSHSMSRFAEFLTVGETYFFREKNFFEKMGRRLFEEIIERKRAAGHHSLRIWSAPCSTGEEPYSLAILLDDVLMDQRSWSISILGSDLNRSSLERAKAGVFREYSFRGTPEWVTRRYFQEKGGQYHLSDLIKQRVTFRHQNMADEVYPVSQTHGMDLIFCRNMLIYFEREEGRKVIARLKRCLSENGWLVVSPAEASFVDDPELHMSMVAGSIVYQKRTEPAPRKVVVPRKPVVAARKGASRSKPEPSLRVERAQPTVTHTRGSTRPSVEEETVDSADALFEELNALHRQARHQESIDRIHGHLRGTTAQGHVAYLLARAEASLGRMDLSLEHVLNALKTESLRADYHYLLAMIQLERHALEEADKALKRVLYLDEKHILAHVARGHLLMQRDQPEAAQNSFRRAKRLLDRLDDDVVIDESEGMTAGHMRIMIKT